MFYVSRKHFSFTKTKLPIISVVELFIQSQFNWFRLAWNNWDYFQTVAGFTTFLFGQLNIVNWILNIYTLSYLISIFMTLGVSTTIIMCIQLRQLSSILYFPRKPNSTSRHSAPNCIRYFRRRLTTTLITIFKANRIFGRALLLFNLVNFPTITLVLLSICNSNFKSILLVGTVNGLVCLYGNHFLAARFCENIHRPAKRLLHLNASVQFRIFREKLRLSLYTMMLHTTNRYGITFGRGFGLITASTFLRVSLS